MFLYKVSWKTLEYATIIVTTVENRKHARKQYNSSFETTHPNP